MSKLNRFSIILPLYNKEKYILETLLSILNQTYNNFELIIVDDGSTDRSINLVNKIEDSRLKIHRQENKGVSIARNVGIKLAANDWICFIDADDLWERDYLENVNNIINKHPEVEVIGVGWRYENGNPNSFYDKEGFISDYFGIMLNYKRLLSSSSVSLKKSVISKVGYFNDNICRGEDLDMWIRISKKCKIYYFPRKLVIYRQNADNRLCRINFPIHKSIVYYLDIKSSIGNEKIFYKKIIIEKIIECIINKKFKDAILLIKKYKLNLIF